MKPCSGSTESSRTCARSPTSKPRSPRVTRPSAAGCLTRTYVPFGEAPVTMAGKTSPIRSRSKKVRERFRRGHLRQAEVETGGNLPDPLPVSRSIDHTLDNRPTARFQKSRAGHVCGDHQTFDHVPRTVAADQREIDKLTVPGD